MARPPVAKLMDYGKFKYESALKARESRKNQAQTVIKEIKLRPKIDPHDYGTKKGHVERFLKQGDKVKVTIMFRGREQSRPELGFKLLQRLAGDIAELGFVESAPKQDGRNMIMVIGPHKRKTEAMAAARAERASRSGSRGAAPSGESEGKATAPAADTAQAEDTLPAATTVPAATTAPARNTRSARDTGQAADASAAAGAVPPADAMSASDAVSASDVVPPSDDAPPANSGSAASSGSAGSAQQTAGPSADAPAPSARPAAPRPTAPRSTPGSASPRPSAPRGTTAARSAATAKPAPPRRTADAPVPGPRPVAADAGSSAASRQAREADR